MKRANFILHLCLIFVLLNFIFISCGQKEKVIEKQMIQISDEELQEKDVGIYKTRESRGKEYKYFSLDFSRIEGPNSLEEFTQYFHFPPIRQYKTGTCWCFAATSLLESELKRLGKGEVKLSEMYTVYWEFIEKARRYIETRGKSFLGHGSEHNAVIAQMKKYGAVRASDYTGLLGENTEHDHGKLFREIKNYLEFCKTYEYWDKAKSIAYVKSILNKHLRKPPKTIDVNGKTMTPKEYLKNELQLPVEDYVFFMSLKSLPFYTKGEFKVPDNWWHSKDYHNVPLADFYKAVVGALKKGFSVALGGDISEPGLSGTSGMAIIPTFDIPQKLIDQDSREFRFINRTSTDDHAVHIVGHKETGDHTWFLIKDTIGSIHRGPYEGYYFMRDDYLRLKMLTFMVHRDAVPDLLAKFEEKQSNKK